MGTVRRLVTVVFVYTHTLKTGHDEHDFNTELQNKFTCSWRPPRSHSMTNTIHEHITIKSAVKASMKGGAAPQTVGREAATFALRPHMQRIQYYLAI